MCSHSDAFGCIRKHLEAFGRFRRNSRFFQFSQFVFKVFAIFSKFSDGFGSIRTCSDAFGCIGTHSEASGRFRKQLDFFGIFALIFDGIRRSFAKTLFPRHNAGQSRVPIPLPPYAKPYGIVKATLRLIKAPVTIQWRPRFFPNFKVAKNIRG